MQVSQGFVDVAPGAREAALVGPETEVAVFAGVAAPPPREFTPAMDERPVVKRMLDGLPKPDYSLPKVDSPAVDRIRSGGPLRVGVDMSAGSEKANFLQDFLPAFLDGHLGGSWKADVDYTWKIDSAREVGGLGTKLDVIIAPAETERALRGTKGAPRAIPFVEKTEEGTGNQVVWYLLVSAADARFSDALTDFLRVALENGVYGALYKDAFRRPPDYRLLREVIDST